MVQVFARVAGWIALLLGVIGFFVTDLLGLIQFDRVHTIVYFALGIIGLACAKQASLAKAYAYVLGVVYVLIGIVGFFYPQVGSVHLEVTENLLHLLLGSWGVYAAMGEAKPVE